MGARLVWLGVASAAVLGVAVAWLMVRLGPRLSVVDLPDGDLKPHTGRPVPLGGVALMVGLHGGLAVAGHADTGLILATGLAFLVGLVDDIRGLSPLIRLAGAAASGVLLVGFSDLVSGWAGTIAAVALVMLLLNAVNLFDGLDALASSVGAVAAGGLAVYATSLGVADSLLPVVLSGALAGILIFNWPPARLYLGDNGAYVLGITLAWAVLRTADDWGTGLLGASLVGIPLIDLGVTVVRRIRIGHPLFAGDRDHTYDRLHRKWGMVWSVAVAFAAIQVVWSGLVIGVSSAAGQTPALITAAVVGAGVVIVGWLTAEPGTLA